MGDREAPGGAWWTTAVPALVAGVLWVAVDGVGTALGYHGIVPVALVRIVLPTALQNTVWFAPPPRDLLEPAASGLLVAALVALALVALRRTGRHRTGTPVAFTSWWLAVVLAAVVAGACSGFAVVVGAWPPDRLLGLIEPLSPYLQGAALWGVVWGWVPALVALRLARRGAARPSRAAPAVVVPLVVLTALAVLFAPTVPAPPTAAEAVPSPSPTRNGPAVPAFAPGRHVISSDWCTDDQVEVAVVGHDAALGHRETVLSVTNHTGVDCTIRGYPDLEFADVTDGRLPVHVVHGSSFMAKDAGPKSIVLKAGQRAVSTIGWDAQANDPDNTAAYVHLAAYPGAERAALPFTGDVVRGCSVGVTAWRRAKAIDFRSD